MHPIPLAEKIMSFIAAGSVFLVMFSIVGVFSAFESSQAWINNHLPNALCLWH